MHELAGGCEESDAVEWVQLGGGGALRDRECGGNDGFGGYGKAGRGPEGGFCGVERGGGGAADLGCGEEGLGEGSWWLRADR